jgi:hypothetical protein
MNQRYIVVAYNPATPNAQRYVLTDQNKWAFKYAGVNDALWMKYNYREIAEQAANFLRDKPTLKGMTVEVERY